MQISAPPIPTQHPVLEAHAIRFTQGGRTVYHLSLSMPKFDHILPTEVKEETIADVNRRFQRRHAADIEGYLQGVDQWVFGPVTLSIGDQYIEFESYSDRDESNEPTVGHLRVLESGRNELKILDGQHRRKAIRDFRRAQLKGEAAGRQARFEESQMPIALYIESSSTGVRQMFADMAKQRPMDGITTARFDARDPFNRAAAEVMEASSWIKPYVEMDRSTVTRTSPKLTTFNQLAKNIKVLHVGYGGRVSKIRMHDAENEYDDLVNLGVRWTDNFLTTARDEYRELSRGVDGQYVAKQRSKTLAYNGTILRMLAGAHYEWGHQFPDRDYRALAEYVKSLDFRPGLDETDLVEIGILEPRGKTPISRIQEVRGAIDRIVATAADA